MDIPDKNICNIGLKRKRGYSGQWMGGSEDGS